MIKFFRRIRQKLLAENKFSKYLIYAIGEIALVMLGILLALQVNNWNQTENKKQVELDYLFNLKTEVEINIKELERVRAYRKTALRALTKLMELSGTAPPHITSEELAHLLNVSTYDYASFVFQAKTPVLEEIISSGNLITINNSELRNHLITWEQKMDGVWGTQKDYKKFRNEMLSLIVKRGSMKELGKADIYTADVVGLNFPDVNKSLLQNPEAGNLFFLMYGEASFFDGFIYPKIKEHLEELLNLIQQETNR